MRRGGRTAVVGLLGALLTVPVLGAAPASAVCGDVRTTAARFAPPIRPVAYVTAAEPAPSPTPCPTPGPLGPTSDDDSGTTKATGLAVAAVVLIVGGVVLRRRANRD
jgi:hypothetical protein